MGTVRQHYVDLIWDGIDPFTGFPPKLYEYDLQGWGNQHPFLIDAIHSHRPSLIVEIGVWKGASTVVMASELRNLGLDGAVVCVDTWLGSVEHWLNPADRPSLAFDHGYPSINRKFMGNVVSAGVQDYVIPIPLDSINAALVMAHHNLQADVIHLDAAHDYRSVLSDLEAWWPRLKSGGLLIGDDYYMVDHWPGVKQAFDEFFAPKGCLPLENHFGKCRLIKP